MHSRQGFALQRAMDVATSMITVCTWNILSTGNQQFLGEIAGNCDVICLQEVHDFRFKGDTEDVPGGGSIGRRKLTSSDPWYAVFWPNPITVNASMGLAILWSPTVNEMLKGYGITNFNASHGSASMRRGMPWIEIGQPKLRIYSYHSDSSQDNTEHARNVSAKVVGMLDLGYGAVCGDFNITTGYFAAWADKFKLGMAVPATPTRAKSGKKIDYVVHTPSVAVAEADVQLKGGGGASDHRPVFYTCTWPA